MSKFPYATVSIFIACVLVYALQVTNPAITNEFALSRGAPIWTYVTYIFLHGSIEHIFYNMLALLMFGYILEYIIGTKRFLLVFFSSGIISGIVGLSLYNSIIGASGAIFGIIGCLTMIRPKMVVFAFGMPMPLYMASVFWMFLDLVGIVYPDNVAHAGHIGGFIFGAFIGAFMRKKYGEKRKTYFISEDRMRRWEDDWMN